MEILVAIITGLIALIGTIITVSASSSKTVREIGEESALNDAEIKGDIALVRKDIQNLTEQINKMQSLYTRVTALERRADVEKKQTDDACRCRDRFRQDLRPQAQFPIP